MCSFEQMNSDIKLAESQINEINTSFLCFHSQFSKQCQTLQKTFSNIHSSLQNQLKQLQSKQHHLNSLQNSLTNDKRKSKTRGVKVSVTGNVVVKLKTNCNNYNNDVGSKDASIKLFVTMDGRALQMFLNDRADEHEFIGDEVRSALKLSSDPAMLVLDALEGFHKPHLKRAGLEYDGNIVRSSCVVLLEQLLVLKPEIRKPVRVEARAVAALWRERMRVESDSDSCFVVVLGFLLLVAVYWLWWDFDKDELWSLCEVVKGHGVVGELHSRLGSRGKSGESGMASEAVYKEPDTPPVNDAFVSPSVDPSIGLCSLCKVMDGNTLQMFLNDRIAKHGFMGEEVQSALKLSSDPAKLVLDAMVGFFQPHLRKGTVEYEAIVVRSSCVLLLEQLMELKAEIKTAVREEARRLASLWREKLREESGSYMAVLGFLLLVAVYWLWWDFDKDDLRIFCEVVRQHRVVGELNSRLGFLLKREVGSMASQAQKKEPYTPVKKTFVSPSTDPSIELSTLCKGMDANGLKSYLIKHAKDMELLDEKVLDCLRWASDPAKLVFNAVKDYYLELGEFLGDTSISCCNLLLEQLIKLSPHIDFLLKEETMNFAARWKARLAMENTKPFLVFGFLKFVAAYRLSSSFRADEILSLFTMLYDRDGIYESDQIPSLCRALGLELKIPELIQILIKENKQLEAVRYICAFNLADKYPPVPLLKSYLEYAKTAALKTCKDFNDSVKAQNKCAKKQIRALQSVIRCIFDFKLDFECSPIELQQRIRQLEREKEKRKEEEKTRKKKKSAPTAPSQLDFKGMKKRATCPLTAQTQFLQGCSEEKRPRTDTVHNSMTSNMNSLDSPSAEFTQFGSHDTSYGMAHDLGSAQFGASRMPYNSINPIVNPIDLGTNYPSDVSRTPRFGTPSSAGCSSMNFHPPS